ncbi:hypothetical protein MTO96_037303 [Rhipicephalus appendiculatus]
MKEDGESSFTKPSPSGRYELYPVDIVYHNNRKSGEYRVYVFTKQVGVDLDSSDRGRLVVVEVRGWMPYMFLKVKDDDIKKMKTTVSEFLKQASAKVGFCTKFAHGIDSSSDLKFIDGYGYRPDDAKERFIKVSVSDPSVYKKFAEIVPYEMYMAQVDHVCQFKIDVGLAHPNKLLYLGSGVTDQELPNGSLRLTRSLHNLTAINNDGKEIPTLKAMSIAIKCISESGAFPKAKNMGDRIIQIASVTTSDVLRAKHDRAHFEKCVFVVVPRDSAVDAVVDAVVEPCDSERSMLEKFREHVVSADPDIITGYKVRSFDWPYILDRFDHLSINPAFSRRDDGGNWSYYLRDDGKEAVRSHDRILVDMCDVVMAERNLRSDSLGSVVAEFLPGEPKLVDLKWDKIKELHEDTSATRAEIARCCVTHALIPLNLMIKFNTAMSMLELSNITGVPMRYIYDRGQQVRVMTLITREARIHEMIFPTKAPGAAEQRDSRSDVREGSSTGSGDNEAEAKAKKPASSRKRKASSSDLDDVGAIHTDTEGRDGDTYRNNDSDNDSDSRNDRVDDKEEGIVGKHSSSSKSRYKGAKVVDPKSKYYDEPVVTLDFASMYPSIIIAMNLCYSTLRLQHSEVQTSKQAKRQRVDEGNDKEDGDDYKYTQGRPSPVGDEFEPESVRKGILPTVLEGLLESRKQVKEEMEKCKDDPFIWSVLNERQLAIKKCANSVYGFTGTKENAMLPCVEIARSITAYGRALMDNTIDYVKGENQNVIYGDTDSVMILCEGKTVAEAMNMGKELAEIISSHFPDPIRLEFEKVYKPYLIVGKKKYAGAVYCSNPHSHDKLDIKGLDAVRKDCTPYVSQITKDCLQHIIEKRDVKAASDIATKAVHDLGQGRVGVAELILNGTHTRKKYKNKPTHLVVVEKRNARGGKPAKVGERIPYVICKQLETDNEELRKEYEARAEEFTKCKNKVKMRYERKIAYRAEDPDYAKDKDLPIDYAYYLTKLKRSLIELFTPVLGGRREALSQITAL